MIFSVGLAEKSDRAMIAVKNGRTLDFCDRVSDDEKAFENARNHIDKLEAAKD